jgi:hypothetical protein
MGFQCRPIRVLFVKQKHVWIILGSMESIRQCPLLLSYLANHVPQGLFHLCFFTFFCFQFRNNDQIILFNSNMNAQPGQAGIEYGRLKIEDLWYRFALSFHHSDFASSELVEGPLQFHLLSFPLPPSHLPNFSTSIFSPFSVLSPQSYMLP